MGMTIDDLLESTNKVDGYSLKDNLSKEVGPVFVYNKTVKVKAQYSIIEITMMIKGLTDMVSKNGRREPVAAHKVMVAIKGVKQREVTGKQLVNEMRVAYDVYKNKNKFSDEDLITKALNEGRMFKDNKIIMQSEREGRYVIIDPDIDPSKSEIRVWCSCSSYYWVFQYYNIENDVNIKQPGRPVNMPAYRYRTNKGFDAFKKGRPMRNPNKAPGVCKHIRLLLGMLINSSLVADSSKWTRKEEKQYKLNFHKFKKENRLSAEEYSDLLKEYEHDHNKKVQERKTASIVGFASLAQAQRGLNYGAQVVKKMR